MKSLLFCLLLISCTDESATIRTLHAAGFSEISTTGYSFFQCGDDDTFHTGFHAKNPRGEWVDGTVCCGMMTKGCTVRF